MTADTLREAAELMREQHGLDHIRHTYWMAVADWLEDVNFRAYGIGLPVARTIEIKHAETVASAYFWSQS